MLSKAFETNPELEFEFFLTKELGLGTVTRMRSEMTQAEYIGWTVYFGRQAQRNQVAKRR
jgi:hypothetical protein